MKGEEEAFCWGVLAAVGVFFVATHLPRVGERNADARRIERIERDAVLALTSGRGRTGTPENYCRHCKGNGECADCEPTACRVCKGRGLQPIDEKMVARLDSIWKAG